jgi:hypothetical protein
MIAAIIVALILSGVIGVMAGLASKSMTAPASTSFQLYGPIFAACAGFVCGLVALIFGVELIGLLYCTIAGGVFGFISLQAARAFRG